MKYQVQAVAALLALIPGGARAQSDVLIGDSDNKIVRFSWPAGQALDHFVGAGISPLDNTREMAIGPDNRLYVASYDNASILRYHMPSGYFSDTFVTPGFGGISNVEAITFGSDGMLYAASGGNSRIIQYNPTTGTATQFVPRPNGGFSGGLSGPTALAFGPDGHLYVASWSTNSVLRYNGATGDFIDQVVSPAQVAISSPRSVVFDGDGMMYVSSQGTDSVIRVNPVTLDASVFVPSASGGLNDPHGLAFYPSSSDAGRILLVVAVGGNGRVLRYDGVTGQYLGVFIESNAGSLGNNPLSILVLPENCNADLNGDGQLNFFDVSQYLSSYNSGCP